MELISVTTSTGPPVSLSDAKAHLMITGGDHDVVLLRKIGAATQVAEALVRGHTKFVQGTHDVTLGEFPGNSGRITLPLPPLKSITHVRYYNSTNGASTLSSTVWDEVKPAKMPGFIEPKSGETWPDTYLRPDAVSVRCVVGYGTKDDVPEIAKEAVLVLTESLFDPTRLPWEEAERIADRLLGKLDYGHYS